MSNSKMIAALLGGAAIGAAVGLLLAPQSGADTRKKIRKLKNRGADYMDDLVENGKKTWYETKGKVETNAGIAADELDDFVRHILQNGKNWWGKTKNKAGKMAGEAEYAFEQKTNNGKKAVNETAK
ncbi:MAG TPA: YtxH domain-containing protein [Saprospiraceae bacterium]|nr:YtxH domain-containing protein [Saprospiraceae bacterium]